MQPQRNTDTFTLVGYATGIALCFLATAGIYLYFWLMPSAPHLMWLSLGLTALVGAATGVLLGHADAAPPHEQEPDHVPHV